MKKFTFLMVLFALVAQQAWAQTTIKLELKHFLGSTPFAFGTKATNDLNQDFDVNRLEYYISNLQLVHDGGKITSIPDYYILADASKNETYDLGSYNINAVEAFRFSIGVDSAKNHLDPASYAATHPLSPKSPSMHWGWTSGYRFVAMEGKCGNALSQVFEVHALGNQFYYDQHIKTSGVKTGSEIVIGINADYVEALSGINVSSAPVSHGSTGISIDLLDNFWKKVFTDQSGQGNNVGFDNLEKAELSFYPNPSSGDLKISWVGNADLFSELTILNSSGAIVCSKNNISNGAVIDVSNLPNGVYFAQIKSDAIIVSSKKIVVLK